MSQREKPITIQDIIGELQRENAMRKRVYPRANIKPEVADRRIAILDRIIADYQLAAAYKLADQASKGPLQGDLFAILDPMDTLE